MVSIGDTDLSHLAAVERSLADLAGRLTAAVHAADGATGADAAGAVGVALDASGRVSGVTLTQGWRRLVGAAGLTGAVQEAGRAAGAEFARRLDDATAAGPTPVGALTPKPPVPPASAAAGTPTVSPRSDTGLTSLRDVIDAVGELRTQLTDLQNFGDAGDRGVAGRDPAGRVEVLVAQDVVQQITLIDDWWAGASDKAVSLALTQAIRAAYAASDQVGARGILNGRTYRELSGVLSDPQRLSALFTPPVRRNPR
jgi:hypothetical protein